MGCRCPRPSGASHVIGLGLHDSLRMAVPELQTHQYPEFVAHYRRHFLAREDAMALFAGMKEVSGGFLEDSYPCHRHRQEPPRPRSRALPRPASGSGSSPRAALTRPTRSRIRPCFSNNDKSLCQQGTCVDDRRYLARPGDGARRRGRRGRRHLRRPSGGPACAPAALWDASRLSGS